MSDIPFMPTREQWEATVKENAILKHQLDEAAKKANELWKLKLLLEATGFDVVREKDSFFLRHDGLEFRPQIKYNGGA